MNRFVHLHVHSEYSFDSGFFNVGDYVRTCYAHNYSVAALTERFNLYSFLFFYNKCLDFGIKPIIGCEIFLESEKYSYGKAVLLCKNYKGYRNLVSILAKSYLDKDVNGVPIVKYRCISSLSDDLIAIGISVDSDIGKALLNNDFVQAEYFYKFWSTVFKDRFYLSITRMGFFGENLFFERVMDFSLNKKIIFIATNEVAYLRKNELLSYRSKIAMFDDVVTRLTDSYDKSLDNKYFKSDKEMKDLFFDIPNVITNVSELVKRCNFFLKFGYDYSPKYKNRTGLSLEKYISLYTFNKLIFDYYFFSYVDFEIYISRLKVELNVIVNIGFSNYFLVTHEFICWAKDNDIFVGPGRGSGVGSLVAYLLYITGIDPVRNDLLFERFLNKDRISSPDFDVDFCIEGRDLVMDYIFEFYGIKNVAQIVTFGCMTVKSVIRDVGRILGYSYSFIDKVIKTLSSGFGVSLKHELIHNPFLKYEYDASNDVQIVIALSLKIEGVIKGIGKHAGGLLISSVELLGYLPMQYEDLEFNFLTQLDKDDSESLGFTKFDFLGLKTLTIFADVLDTLCSYYSLHDNYFFCIDYEVFDDDSTYILLDRGDTLGIFQFESYGIKSVLQKIHPYVFSDIVSLIALYRPGPLQSGLLLSFAKRKMGDEVIDYIHPKLTPILRETYGMIVYQEQVMLIAQIFANYSLADADLLRIAMSKKKTLEMLAHLKNFCYGAELNGVDKYTAEDIFYLVEKFAGYGFNKAHSVGYAVLAYTGAWLKTNFNVIFLSSLLSSDMDNIENVDFYIDECIYFGIKILPPDVNRSNYCFSILNDNAMLFGFGFIKGLGKTLIADIIFTRGIFGFFNSFFDFLYRIEVTLLTKKMLQALVYSGIFDKINKSRFKLVLIGNKLFDLYAFFNVSNYISFDSILDNFFNYFIKNFYYMVEYKNTEFASNRYFLGSFIIDFYLNYYINDFFSISKLSHKSGIYYNEIFCGVIISIYQSSKSFYSLCVGNLYDTKLILLSSLKYVYKKELLRPGKMIVIGVYSYNKRLYELFVEDFYFFKIIFSEFFDIYLSSCFLSDNFIKRFFHVVSNKSGNSIAKIRLLYFNYGKWILIKSFIYMGVSPHDDLILELKKNKEILDIKITYKF
ncbi:DNA polymerase III subunit alpha [Candidatus Azoamicus ciliaticola]|uniref:DNA polymerase III subunit alpha n=1 Tax=Candidatus Azoamicus ciliaticola TaxID=2652803 RepID=A0A6J5JVX8_9GAMM|nr:DNA polymerase III subunit alpha [Candidatus Azoamicus ciliaticola]CAB3976468.1 Error-prone DNA polymerase [Candidatus Azoamicus ciliaticola]